MNRFVADPHWHDYITWYFFLGGIAAGSYALASLVNLLGHEPDRRGVRVADYIAFPLVNVCGVLLILDLNRPERFWHMLIQSETYRPMFKWYSPISVGSWGLSAFGACSFVSFATVLVEDGWIGRPGWAGAVAAFRKSLAYRIFSLFGAGTAFFLGAYTGTLLSATNQPVWSNSTWLSALFLASAASTGLATMDLIGRWRLPDIDPGVVDRIERTDSWAIVLELVVLGLFVWSLGAFAGPTLSAWPGLLIPAFVVPIGLILPLLLKHASGSDRAGLIASILVLVGGFVLRAAIVGIPASQRLADAGFHP